VGLGNPGTRYENTRHNIGFTVLQKIVLPHFKLRFKENSGEGLLAKTVLADTEVHFLLPQTYMNRSGEVVSTYLERARISHENLLVIYDDLDLSFGKLRFRASGSSGGHQGMESLIQHLSSGDFNRLRIGIGRPTNEKNVEDYVLEEFTEAEKETLSPLLESAGKVVKAWLDGGPKKARDFLSRG
jgi:PTH1 family peptidyl-tRNA hydrolase